MEEDVEVRSLLQEIEELELFKQTWIYEAMQKDLQIFYNDLFTTAMGGKDNDVRINKLEQMKGVAYAKGLINSLIAQRQEVRENLKEIKEENA